MGRENIRVWMLPEKNAAAEDRGGIPTLVRAYYQHGPLANIEYVDKQEDAQVLAVHAGMKTGLRGKPVVAHVHGLYWTAEDAQTDIFHRQVNASVIESIREAHVVTVPSQWVAQVIRRDMRLEPVVLPHGVDTKNISSTQPSGHYVLWNKNRIADACNPDAVAFLAERFPDREFHTTLWNHSKKKNVRVIGLQSHDDMLKTIERSFLYLSTAKETFGIGTLEALAAGVPVLGWAEGGNLDLVSHKQTGYLAQPGNYEDLAAGYKWLEANRMRMRDVCRRAADEYKWLDVSKKLRSVYLSAIRAFDLRSSRKVSVVVPCYNKGNTLAKTLDSILAQTLPAADIFVVDNNSTDNTAQVVEQYAEKGVRYLHEEKQGVAHARNAGIEKAHSPYICCLDADDSIAPEFLATCVDTLIEDPTLGVAYTRLLPIVNGQAQRISQWPNEYNFDAFLEKRNQVPTCAVFRKDVFARLGGYRQRYAPGGAGAEDAEFYLRMGARGYKAKLATQEPLFLYSMGQGFTSRAEYKEPDWTWWHPWAKDRAKLPFAALAKTAYGSHMVRSYSKPKVSVVIPCAGHHVDTLMDVLDSLDAQTFLDWEVVVVLDFPQNEYKQRVSSLKQAYPFAQWVYGTQQGAGAARNLGAILSSAPNLLFLDADDFLHPQALEVMFSARQDKQEPEIIYTDYTGHAYIEENLAKELAERNRLLSHDKTDGYAHVSYQSLEYDCERAIKQPELNKEPYIWCLVSALVPRLYHVAIGGFDEKMESWEDWDYWLRMARAGFCFRRVAQRLVDYRFYSGTRRELGRQIAKDLIQYLTEKYKGEKPMPCGGCGRKRASAIAQQDAQSPLRLAAPQLGATGMGGSLILVRLNDNNIGTHPIVGGVTRTSYGYRSHGDEFFVAQSDYEARKDLFLLVEEISAPIVEETVEQVEPPQEGTLAAIEGMTPVLLRSLESMNIQSLEDVNSEEGKLQTVPGITTVMIERILKAVGQVSPNQTPAKAEPTKKPVGRPKGSSSRS